MSGFAASRGQAQPLNHDLPNTSPNLALLNPFELDPNGTSQATDNYKSVISNFKAALETYKSALDDYQSLTENDELSSTIDYSAATQSHNLPTTINVKRVDPKPPPMPPPAKPTPTPTNTPKPGYGQNHNFAMVCLSSRDHTTYCQNLPRGYYCSGNGYLVQKQEATARYEPCESVCECINIGISPPCWIRKADMSCQF